MSASDDRPYAVGKGKPPLSGRWGPGQSGNPNGSSKKVRRRKDKSVAGRLRAIANEKIMLPESGEEVSIADLVLKRIVHIGMTGKGTAPFKVFGFLNEHGVYDPPSNPVDDAAAQQASIAAFLDALAKETEREDEMTMDLEKLNIPKR